MGAANQRWRNIVPQSFIDCAHAENEPWNIDGLVQDWANSSALAMEPLQSWAQLSIASFTDLDYKQKIDDRNCSHY